MIFWHIVAIGAVFALGFLFGRRFEWLKIRRMRLQSRRK